MIEFKCPKCKSYFGVNVSSLEDARGATMDCSGCGALLLCRPSDLEIVDFHEHISKGCPSWPKDGKGTGYIEICPDGETKIVMNEKK